MTITSALEAALPPGSLAPFRIDYSVFCGFDAFDSLSPEARAQVIASPDDAGALRGYDAVAGHFCLPTLRAVAPASAVCTVLREPRARLLSLYTYWRTAGAGDDFWAPYRIGVSAWRPVAEFLSDPRLAPAIDNGVCRMLLAGDPRLPTTGFVARQDVEVVAAAAIELLDALGFVGILELGQQAWEGVGHTFDVTLEPRRAHVTGELGSAASIVDDGEVLTGAGLELLEERTAVDALIYDHALERAGVASRERARVIKAAFASQLVRLGDLCGASAAKAARDAATVERLSDRLQQQSDEVRRKDEYLAQMRSSLEAMQTSKSWRFTAPLRSAKRQVRGRSKRADAQ